jgi:hypothetical protein
VAIGVNGDHRRSFLTNPHVLSHRIRALLAETVALALAKATLLAPPCQAKQFVRLIEERSAARVR